jgi:arabinose-5-phosphate isomerase
MLQILETAASRATHFASAIQWISSELSKSSSYQESFCELVEEFSRCSISRAGQTRSGEPRRQVVFLAVGKSAKVAELAVSLLISIGIRARFLHPSEAFHGDFGLVEQGNTVVAISNGGRSQELLAALPNLRERECKLFSITAKQHSPLAVASDRVLLIPPFEEFCPLGQAPFTSSLTTLALCQLAAAATLENSALPLDEYARNHPGGSIGKRIFVKVDDIMCQGENLPCVVESLDFMKCVSEMTQRATPALLVVSSTFSTSSGGKELLGIICERELRLAMEKFGPQVFMQNAEAIMNRAPIVLNSGTLAIDALQLMEDRPKPLNVLPVLNTSKELVGLLRIHDLISHGISLS